MLSWFRQPRPPLAAPEMAWLNDRSHRLHDAFAARRLHQREIILPRDATFRAEQPRFCFDQVAALMDMDTTRDVVVFRRPSFLTYLDRQSAVTTEVYDPDGDGRRNFVVETAGHNDPFDLVAAAARAVAHVKLLELGLGHWEDADLGYLADLTTVLFGFGIYTANSVLAETTWTGFEENVTWNLQSRGWMSMPMFGFALATFAFQRRDHRPHWKRYLRPDVRHPFQSTLRWLVAGGEILDAARFL